MNLLEKNWCELGKLQLALSMSNAEERQGLYVWNSRKNALAFGRNCGANVEEVDLECMRMHLPAEILWPKKISLGQQTIYFSSKDAALAHQYYQGILRRPWDARPARVDDLISLADYMNHQLADLGSYIPKCLPTLNVDIARHITKKKFTDLTDLVLHWIKARGALLDLDAEEPVLEMIWFTLFQLMLEKSGYVSSYAISFGLHFDYLAFIDSPSIKDQQAITIEAFFKAVKAAYHQFIKFQTLKGQLSGLIDRQKTGLSRPVNPTSLEGKAVGFLMSNHLFSTPHLTKYLGCTPRAAQKLCGLYRDRGWIIEISTSDWHKVYKNVMAETL